MRIIPAIDIISGKCVRLTQGNYATQKIYNENPVEIAKRFEAHGLEYLHVVDLDGAKSSRIINYTVLERIATQTNLKIDFGGGIKSDEDLHIAFESGANQVTGGSIAVKNPNLFLSWLDRYGSEKIILGADTQDGKIAIQGWQEESDNEVIPFVQNYLQKGITYVLCTDINKDGMLQGPSFELYKKMIASCKNNNSLRLIASGGVSKLEDLSKLASLGCEAAIIGKAIYENKIPLHDIEKYKVSL